MSELCESNIEEYSDFNLFHDDKNESKEHQKILKNVIEEFKKNKENKNQNKLYKSTTIKKPQINPYNIRNYMPRNINQNINGDGTFTETKVERQPDGKEKITQTRYDRNHNVISSKVYYKNNNINNLNYNNNYNNNVNNNQQNNNQRQFFRGSNGYTMETFIKTSQDGKQYEVKIFRDENNIIVKREEKLLFGNRPHNMNMQAPLYSMPPPNMLNNNINPPFIPNNNNMNNMRLNPNINNFRNNNQIYPMNPMHPMVPPMYQMNPMNMNMNGMPMPMPMMNNFGYPFMMMPMGFPNINVNRVDPRILNSLPETEVGDASKMDPDSRNCVICLEDFKDKEHIICLPCIHVFHSECIKSWLERDNACPTCKFELTFENLNAHS